MYCISAQFVTCIVNSKKKMAVAEEKHDMDIVLPKGIYTSVYMYN